MIEVLSDLSTLGMVALIIGITTPVLVVLYEIDIAPDFLTHAVTIATVGLALVIFIPSKETMYTMLVNSYITADNIDITVGTAKDLVDYVFEKIKEVKQKKVGNYMTYGASYNLFFKSNKDISAQEKIEKLKQYTVGDMLTLLRNIEESPNEYESEIIKSVYKCLFDKGIMCI